MFVLTIIIWIDSNVQIMKPTNVCMDIAAYSKIFT